MCSSDLRRLAVSCSTGKDALTVDEHLDRSDVPCKVVGLFIGGREPSLEDRRVLTRAGRMFVSEPLLEVGHRRGVVVVEMRARRENLDRLEPVRRNLEERAKRLRREDEIGPLRGRGDAVQIGRASCRERVFGYV